MPWARELKKLRSLFFVRFKMTGEPLDIVHGKKKQKQKKKKKKEKRKKKGKKKEKKRKKKRKKKKRKRRNVSGVRPVNFYWL